MNYEAEAEAARKRADEAKERARKAEERAQELLHLDVDLRERTPSTERSAEAQLRDREAHADSLRLHLEAAELHELHARHEREDGNEMSARKADARAGAARGRAEKASRDLDGATSAQP
jgi:hypothetical protein